jgi:hypothetical protein
MRRLVGLVIALLAAFVVGSGCATTCRMYEGPKRPQSEVAVLVPHGDARIVFIDGVRVQAPFLAHHGEIEVLPGPHNVAVGFSRREVESHGTHQVIRTWWSPKPLSIGYNFRAGHRYMVVNSFFDYYTGTWNTSAAMRPGPRDRHTSLNIIEESDKWRPEIVDLGAAAAGEESASHTAGRP